MPSASDINAKCKTQNVKSHLTTVLNEKPFLYIERGNDNIFTKEEKQQIINDYGTLKNYSEVAKKHNTSYSTVWRIVKNAVPQAKKEKSFSEYIEEQSGEFYKLLDLYIEILGSREKLESSPINQIASAFGTIVEKFTAINGAGNAKVTRFESILEELKGKKNE